MSPTPATPARAALAVAGTVLAATTLASCASGDVRPSDSEFAGRAQGSNPTALPTAAATTSREPSTAPTGTYTDGTYTASESYGVVDDVVEEDSIDVTLTLEAGYVTGVEVVGHPLLDKSRAYMQGFTDEVAQAVTGRSVEDAHVDALAGASKTSQAFNDAVDAIRAQAAAQASGQATSGAAPAS